MPSAAVLLTLAPSPHAQKLALRIVITLEPTGVVVAGRPRWSTELMEGYY
jgi:uncharacterized protein (DUF302 family)